MVKRLFKFTIICAMVSTAVLTSCQKDLYDPTITVVSKEATDLDFSTTQNVTFNLSYSTLPGFVAEFDLYTENPCELKGFQYGLKEGIKSIGSGVAVSGKFTSTKQFPAYVKELYAYSSNYFAPQLMHATIQNGNATFETVNMSSVATAKAASKASTRNAWDGEGDLNIRDNVDNGKVVTITGAMLDKINDAFPNETRVDAKYYADASLYLQQEAQVWVTPLVTDGVLKNELLYFCYDGEKEDLKNMTQAQRENLKLISVFYGKTSLSDPQFGKYIKLTYYDKDGKPSETFPAGTTVGWALRPHYNEDYYGLTFYSCPAWNPENGTTDSKNHTIYFNAGTEENPFVCFGFEDMPNNNSWGASGDNDCNDMMFNVQLDPIDALNPPPVIPEPKDITSSQKYVGYLGFEDYWPVYFDYDLNDLLVKYQSTVNTKTQTGEGADTNTYITSIEDNYSMVFTGADFNNHFGVIMPISKNLIEKITLTDLQTNAAATDITNTVVTDVNGFIIDICDKVPQVIIPYKRDNIPYIYRVSITLKDKQLKMSDFENNHWMAPYNPFITPYSAQAGRNGSLEVHLPNYMPSQRVINVTSWFGKFDDRSDPSKNVYYVGGDWVNDMNGDPIMKNIFPFAIHLSGVEDFYIPTEHVRIDKTFPRYENWAKSGMTEDLDWYLDHP